MTNEELIHLAETEGKDLTPESLTILHEQFEIRKLYGSIFGELAEAKLSL